MLSYVAAIATAVTLMIGPTMSSAQDSSGRKEPAKWAKKVDMRTVEISKFIEISGVQPLYLLSSVEQQVFRRALLRSVKIVSTGTRVS